MPPTVRDLQAAIAQENAALKPQQEILDTQMTANEQSGQAQQAGLAAQQKTTFGQIEQGAQNKGMFFSGFTPDEQAKYTANTYLPALANLQAAIANTRTSLLGKKADLSKAAYDKASALVENDKNLLADWNKMTAQQQFQASEAEKQRVYDATQREKDRSFQASQNAANRAAQAAASSGPEISTSEKVRAMLDASKGTDGKVSPTTWRQIAAYAYDNGIKFGGADGFANKYWQYANDSHYKDYQVGYDKYME